MIKNKLLTYVLVVAIVFLSNACVYNIGYDNGSNYMEKQYEDKYFKKLDELNGEQKKYNSEIKQEILSLKNQIYELQNKIN